MTSYLTLILQCNLRVFHLSDNGMIIDFIVYKLLYDEYQEKLIKNELFRK